MTVLYAPGLNLRFEGSKERHFFMWLAKSWLDGLKKKKKRSHKKSLVDSTSVTWKKKNQIHIPGRHV